eukprot:CAMPEP_0185901874 /NCGR_PEP_ID=MMETSP0196C-20130402/1183_1 /TAXON_ID=2932 /ORGANISM="Alexandrium fundyense, Strain CCMP1719" /LENGTH=63 /DNA_ID=CAMNT_0028620601 /DNA_START=215 /DNA_END=403 /DNA_ORIENTATION=-
MQHLAILGHHYGIELRSTYGEQWLGLTRHTPPWRSTSAGMCSMTTGWTHRSTLNTSSQEVRQP